MIEPTERGTEPLCGCA